MSKPLRSIMDPVERAATISRRAQNYYITIEDKNGNPKEVGGLGYWSAKAAQKHKEITRRV